MRSSLLALTAALALAAPLAAQTQSGQANAGPAVAMMPAPAVGQAAPDFTAPWADSTGVKSAPISLQSLRGSVVVLAFYPKDRSSGCTAEMTKFRNEYSTLFGPGVVVLPVSIDSLDSHAGWAKDMHFQFGLISDVNGELAKKYGSANPSRPYFNRTIFVIGKDGQIDYSDMRFGALNQQAYDKLSAAIKSAKGN
jgi:thioredoxin-dependent peroxiredoxin